MKSVIIPGLLFSMLVGIPCRADNYYVSELHGDDRHDGRSPATAWQSVSNVNLKVFMPGDTIFFARNETWLGLLRPGGSGARDRRIVIGAYGEGEAPVFDAQGRKEPTDLMSATVLLHNQEYWEIRDIEVRNFEEGDPREPVEKAGVLVLAKDIGILHDFHFAHLKICRINGSLETRTNGGIFFNVVADSIPENRVPTSFEGILVDNCHFMDVDRGGFLTQSYWRTRDVHSAFGETFAEGRVNNWYPSYNIVVQHSRFENIGGNGLVVRVAESPVVQNNLFLKCSLKTTGNASYPYNCNNALWQYNEACYTVYNEGDVDASGFDSDYLCKNTVIRYNYSHHNDWGGLLVCAWAKVKGSFNDGTLVYHNIFQDESHHMIRFSGNITNTEITNNLFVMDTAVNDAVLWYKSWGGIWPDHTTLIGNIFYNEGAGRFMRSGASTRNAMHENILYGSAFEDYSTFDLDGSGADLALKVREVRHIGARREYFRSMAQEAVQIVWPE